jgi:hypothetical protein
MHTITPLQSRNVYIIQIGSNVHDKLQVKLMDITERVLRRLLKESGGANLDGLAAFVDTSGDPTAIIYLHKVVTDNLPGPALTTKPIWEKSENFFMTQVVKGLVRIQPPPAACDDAWQTSYTVGPRLGKLVYGLGYALSPSGKLMASREKGGSGEAKVTASAQGGWSKVFQKKDRIGRRLDDIELPRDKRLTPDDPSDDCILQDPKAGENPINYSYKAEGWEASALYALEAAHDQVMTEIPPEFQAAFIARLEKGGMAFWKNNYAG